MSQNTTTLDIQSVFDAELTRLLALNLPPEEEQIARRYYSQKERDSLDSSAFCGPHESFPITSQADVSNAARLIGHADDPEAVKRCIIAKAKAHGWSIPDAWKEDNDRANNPAIIRSSLEIGSDGSHDVFTGKHAHSHKAYGDQGDDSTHNHEHEHSNDAQHGHSHDSEDRTTATSAHPIMYAPITRIDKNEWLIEGQATSDALDSYGTIFDYESSKRAFLNWRGNIREMHRNQAVGRAIEVIPDDANRCIFLRARISKGARDTWEKILDGTLTGFSIGVPPGRFKSKSVMRNGKSVPMYYDHELAEVSVVDNPGSPNCDIAIVRADGLTTETLDDTEEVVTPEPTQTIQRAGARVSKDTQGSMHTSIGHTLMAAMSQMKNCGCECCQAAMKMIDPDGDDDVDLGGYLDPDGDWQSLYNNQQSNDDMDRALAIVERVLGPAYTRLQGIAGALARNNVLPANNNTTTLPDETLITGAIERAVKAVQVAHDSSLAEVRAVLTAVKEQVDAIAATPVPGAPILNTSALPRPAEKRLVSDPSPNATASPGATYDAMLSQFQQRATSGVYRSLDEQVRDMAAVLAAQPSLPRR